MTPAPDDFEPSGAGAVTKTSPRPVGDTVPAVLAARYGLSADVVAPLEGVHALTDVLVRELSK